MGWHSVEADLALAETTERANACEVLLTTRLPEALETLNLRDGQLWLDETRSARSYLD